MANAREIIRRRKSVKSIGKITKTMEMIATSRFRHIYKRAMNARPYRDHIVELISSLARMGAHSSHPLLKLNKEVKTAAILVLTSNRGLCGGFNGGVFRVAQRESSSLRDAGFEVQWHVCGKKGIQHYRFHQEEIKSGHTDLDERASFERVSQLADFFIEAYNQKQIRSLRVVSTRFISNASQIAEVTELLPLSHVVNPSEPVADLQGKPMIGAGAYDYLPSAAELIAALIPAAFRTQLYQCFLESLVSEQAARMTAMSAATTNGEQMIQALTQQYNRVRQSQITGELLDIMGGVEALKS